MEKVLSEVTKDRQELRFSERFQAFIFTPALRSLSITARLRGLPKNA